MSPYTQSILKPTGNFTYHKV